MISWTTELVDVLLRLSAASVILWSVLKVPFDAAEPYIESWWIDIRPWTAWVCGILIAALAALDPLVPLGAYESWVGWVVAGGTMAAGAKVPLELSKKVAKR